MEVADLRRQGWIHCGGKTVEGLYEAPKVVEGRRNHSPFLTAKSALGDCEFEVVFACSAHLHRVPNISITGACTVYSLSTASPPRAYWVLLG